MLLATWLWDFFREWWWLVGPPVLFPLLYDTWLWYRKWKYFYELEWVLLEIVPPQEVTRTPQAMEQVFACIHSMHTSPSKREKYIYGTLPRWFTCEIASIGGETHFYIRVWKRFRNLVESCVWSQYPDVEIVEAEDYTKLVPPTIPDEEWDIVGTEFRLQKPDPYPIRTYQEFESPQEERRIDPMAALLELFSSIGPDEHLWFQIVVEPVLDKEVGWKAQGEVIIGEMMGREQSQQRGGGWLDDIMSIFRGGAPQEQQRQERPALGQLGDLRLSPEEREIAKAIQRNIGKMGFRVGIRTVHVGRRENFDKNKTIYGFFGAMRQFNSENLNAFKFDSKTYLASAAMVFKKQRSYLRMRRLDWRYRNRLGTRIKYILNTEELATVFHFPGFEVAKAPLVRRIEARKGEPPSQLPGASSSEGG